MQQWLIRKHMLTQGETFQRYLVLGPYLEDEVKQMLEKGELSCDDELCPESNYWFSLHELHEVKKYLNIDDLVLKKILSTGEDEEATQPGLEDMTQSTLKIEQPPQLQTPVEEPIIEKGRFLGVIFFAGLIAALWIVLLLLRSLRS
jgi:hypothetical protein